MGELWHHSPTMTLEKCVVLVSGGSEGIGRACAEALPGRRALISTCALPGAEWELSCSDEGLQWKRPDVQGAEPA
jgi:NAD(P)-dependent dehydrogenase (short-subunit alcohol dehydrogenase family)